MHSQNVNKSWLLDASSDGVSTESGSDRVTGLAISTVAWVDTRSLPLPVLTPLIAINVRAISCDFVDPFVQAERHGTRHHDNSQLLSVVFRAGTRTA